MAAPAPVSLPDCFADLPDPRVERTRLHALTDILVVAVCAVLCGAEGWDDIAEFAQAKREWLAERLPLENGLPCADTYRRVFARLDPQAFGERFLRWVGAVREATRAPAGAERGVAVDGKTLRRSFDAASQQSAIHMVSAFASDARLVLAQARVGAKSNETSAVPAVLSLLDLRGCVVTADAMGCQRAVARQVVEQGGGYVLALKDNHPHLHEDVRLFFEHAAACRFEGVPHQQFTSRDKGHGRIETRRLWQVDLRHLEGRWADAQREWAGLSSLLMLQSERRVGDRTSRETRYYLSSLAGDAARAARAVRQHWGIENGVHWVLDVAFGEDGCRIRRDHGPQNFAVLRHIALNLLRQEATHGRGIKARQKRAGWDDGYLTKLLTG